MMMTAKIQTQPFHITSSVWAWSDRTSLHLHFSTWNSISLTLVGPFSRADRLKERSHSFTVQTYFSGCVPTTVTVFAISSPPPENSQVPCSLHDKICKLLLAIVNFSFPLKEFHLLNLKTSHPSCKFFASCILQSLTFVDACSQPQRTCLIFLPFSPLSGLSLKVYPI